MAQSRPRRLAAFLRAREARDLLALLALAALVGGGWLFVELWADLGEHDLRALDRKIVALLRTDAALRDPVGPPWVEEAVRDVTALGGSAVLVLVTTAVAGYLLLRARRRAAVFIVGAVVGGTALAHLLKGVVARARPEVGAADVFFTASFPSGHAMISTIVYLTLAALAARLVRPLAIRLYLLAVAVVLAFLIGASRVYLGVHHATDVLAGWAAGASWATFCALLAGWLQARGRVERPVGPGRSVYST